MPKLSFFAAALWACSLLTQAAEVPLNPAHLTHYTVVRGDTLWSVAGRFLRDPWRWRDLWGDNPQLTNPHQLYPGDVITLGLDHGEPRLNVQRRQEPERLLPQIRATPLEKPVLFIPIDAIQQFLSLPYVLESDNLDNSPYIVKIAGEHLVGGTGHRIYVRGVDNDDVQTYHIVRPGRAYVDPQTQRILGYAGDFIASARLISSGDPATLEIGSSRKETLVGDRLQPTPDDLILENFYPKPASPDLEGQIIDVLNGVSQIGPFDVVVLSVGQDQGAEIGDVFKIYRGNTVEQDHTRKPLSGTYRTPMEEIGALMVFRLFDNVSFALVMKASGAIHVNNHIRSPAS